ncbi:MAG: L,D-transpeptidase [Parachlamydiales bacterium]|jgi:hypothetical protein
MSVPKLLAFFTFVLFAAIAIAGWWKSSAPTSPQQAIVAYAPIEIPLQPAVKVVDKEKAPAYAPAPLPAPAAFANDTTIEVDRVEELFRTSGKKLPIVETIVYKSNAPWRKGKPAWLVDYATHFHTSRHFIARSRNGKPDYLKQELSEGDKINVFRSDIALQFNLVVDISRNKLWLYYNDLTNNDRQLIKAYSIGTGRPEANSESGILTPVGQYLLGDRILTFAPGAFNVHKGAKVEMVRVFGTRWIPFAKEIGPSTAPAQGYGIHGVPWKENERGELAEDTSSLGKYLSDGCIRLSTKDMEEIYAIVITKPTVVEIVRDYNEAVFPKVDTVAVSKKE